MRRQVKLITDDEKRHFVDLYLQGDTTMRELAKAAGVRQWGQDILSHTRVRPYFPNTLD